MRYGIAYNAQIFAGKVLSNQGSGADGGILAGNGSIQSDKLKSLYQIEGVQNVEPQQSYQLAPPSSDLQ
jgi:hypothetical protein